MVHRDAPEQFRAAVRRIVQTRQSSGPLELRFRHRDGAWRIFESLGTNCLANPHIRGVVFNSRDVTDRKAIQERIQHLAYHDNLTGLPNRELFHDRLTNALVGAARDRHSVALLFFDLDRFKNINDTLGHAAGDLALKRVYDDITAAVRVSDLTFRFGGEEFVVVMPETLGIGRVHPHPAYRRLRGEASPTVARSAILTGWRRQHDTNQSRSLVTRTRIANFGVLRTDNSDIGHNRPERPPARQSARE